ncbi:MAG: hypothetical protein IPK82_22610 [Polyangiaceae bacterium]|nr:hypothetical protein [Polyangiaceae bacterium]
MSGPTRHHVAELPWPFPNARVYTNGIYSAAASVVDPWAQTRAPPRFVHIFYWGNRGPIVYTK